MLPVPASVAEAVARRTRRRTSPDAAVVEGGTSKTGEGAGRRLPLPLLLSPGDELQEVDIAYQKNSHTS